MSDLLNFRRLGTMVDCSRNAVMNVKSVKKWIDTTADLGYNCLMLYTEDTYEVNDNPYFGHLRGRYSKKELKELDDYAYSKGMELLPCIQLLAHVSQVFKWRPYAGLRDADDIFMVGDDRVYDLIDKIFSTCRETFRARIINVGMDEAHMLGRGAYMDRNGMRDRSEILLEHLKKVAAIGEKYGFELLMWGDMFFRSTSRAEAFQDTAQVSDQIQNQIPHNVKLIYWDYYSTDPDHYNRRMEAHQGVKQDIWFAGGLWTWCGLTPHNQYSISTMTPALASCISHGVQDVFMTMWGDNGGECSRFAVLPSLYYVSELAKGHTDPASIMAGFEEKYGIPFREFMNLDLLGTPTSSADAIYNPDKYMLACDCFTGMFDTMVKDGEAASYAACAEKLAKWENHPEYGILFRTARALCDVLSIKFDIGVRTRNAYQENNRSVLKALTAEYEELSIRVEKLHKEFQTRWMQENKPFGFEVQDQRFGGLLLRIRYWHSCLTEYLSGEREDIPELEEPVLDFFDRDEEARSHIFCNSWNRAMTVCPM